MTTVPTDLSAKVEARKAGRETADDVNKFMIETAEALYKATMPHGSDACEAFWHKIREALWPDKPQEAKPGAVEGMSDAESREFGNTVMSFGKFAGTRVDDVEISYLEWIDGDEFRGKLRRYLRSRRVMAEEPMERE